MTGLGLLAALAAIVGANLWLAAGAFVPVVRADRIEYILVSAPAWQLGLFTAIALAVLVALHHGVTSAVRRERPVRWTRWSASSVSYLAPLALFAFNLAALLVLLPGRHEWLLPWAYLAVDLRVWLAPIVLILCIAALDARAEGRVTAALTRLIARPASATGWLELALVAIAAIFVIVSTPILRFNGSLHGDEPKYIRYCENLYQGRGLELSGVKYAADLPANEPPHLLRNVALAAATVPVEARALWDDLRRLREGGIGQRFNRAKYLGGWIIEGKRGGVYQVHLPGVSFLLLPAYFVDRYLLDWTYGDPQFPREMLATVTFALALYLIYSVVIFRFLLDYTQRPPVAFGLALVTVLTLPLADFPFQLYPEVAAGIFIVAIARYVLFGDKTRPLAALWFGILAGYLPWFHTRFLAVSALLLLGGLASAARRPQTGATFAAGWALAIGSMAYYAYHVTGSLLPTALYDVRGDTAVHLRTIGPGLFGFAFDSAFGVLAQSPVLFIALLGIPRLVARRTAAAIFCGLLVFVTAATGASHSFTAALTTPGRYLVGVIPFAALGLAEAWDTFKASRLFKIAFGVALAISLQTAWVYNLYHAKEVGQIVDRSFSGWRLNLAFPTIQGQTFRERAFASPLLWFWVLCVIALIVAPVVYRVVPAKRRDTGAVRASYAELYLMTLAGLGLCGWLASDFTGRRYERSYLMPPTDASVEVARAATRPKAWFAVSSVRGVIPRRSLSGASFDSVSVTTTPFEPRAGDPMHFIISPHGREPGAWGAVELDFGDGTRESVRPLIGPTDVAHVYATSGYYETTARFSSGVVQTSEHVAVAVRPNVATAGAASMVDLQSVSSISAALASRPPTIAVRSLTIRRDRLCVDASDAAPTRLWIATRSSTAWDAASYPIASGCVGIGPGGAPPSRSQLALFVLASDDGSARSDVIAAFWPRPDAILDVPIVVRR